MLTFKSKFNRRFKQKDSATNSLTRISSLTGIKKSILQEVFDRGVGAFRTNPSSVRPHVTSPEQWGQARVYAFVQKVHKAKKTKKKKINQDQDLFKLLK